MGPKDELNQMGPKSDGRGPQGYPQAWHHIVLPKNNVEALPAFSKWGPQKLSEFMVAQGTLYPPCPGLVIATAFAQGFQLNARCPSRGVPPLRCWISNMRKNERVLASSSSSGRE